MKTAADRCEAVLFLISPVWRDSRWCQAEFLLAKTLGKTVFGVLIEAIPLDTLPNEMTTEWQLCDLVAGSERRVFHVESDPIVAATDVSFGTVGLQKLRLGLQKSGLDPSTFPWPPPQDPARAPYRGLKALDVEDAAMFFGREAAIVRGLDALRGLRERGVERMLVVLGASGAGKSSFLRAGLWPRLARDDRHFLPLPVIRPARAVISGPTGLIASLDAALRQRGQSVTRAEMRNQLQAPDGFERLLSDLQKLAGSTVNNDALPPTIVIPIDQAEELFAAEGRQEADTFLALLGQMMAPVTTTEEEGSAARRRAIAVFAIRSDSYERLQTEPRLQHVKPFLFDLRPLATAEYKAVIEGPAARATAAGRKLVIELALTEKLLTDSEGADALPLLAFTLERLFVEYGGDGDLRLNEYDALGGSRGAIEAAIEASFAEPGQAPVIPSEKTERDRLLRSAFVPWLARVDPDTEERKRRVARWEEIPAESRPLVERLIDQRLLVRDRRLVDDLGQETIVVEVAHEALLRQWNTLATWLDEDAESLKQAEAVKRTASEWRKNGSSEAWLVHTGARLEAARALYQRPDFARLLGTDAHAYLIACHERDEQARAEREAQGQRELEAARTLAAETEKRRQAEVQRAEEAEARVKDRDVAAARLRRRAWILTAVAVLAVGAAVASGIFYWRGERQREISLARQLAAQARAITSRNIDLLQRKVLLATTSLRLTYTPEAGQILYEDLSRLPLWGTRITHQGPVGAVSFSPDSRYVATRSNDQTAQVTDWHTKDPLAESCVHLTRNLTAKEWQQYAGGESYRLACPNLPGPEESESLVW